MKIFGFLLLSFIWGTTWLAIKIGLEGTPPFLGASLRFLLSGSILVAIGGIKNRGFDFSPGLLKLSAQLGILMFSLSYGAVYWAEQFLPSGLTSIIFATMPFFTVIFVHLILKNEKFTLLRGVGMVTGFIGIILIFSESTGAGSSIPMKGVLVLMISPIVSGLSTVLMKKNVHHYDALFINGWSMLIGGTILGIIHLFFTAPSETIWNGTTITALLYLSLIGSALAFNVLLWMMKHSQATTLSFITLLAPVVAVFLGALVLSESLTAIQMIGSVLVLSGVLVSEVLSRRKRNPA